MVNFDRGAEEELDGGPRSKVEDDLEIGNDLLKISQRRNYEDVDIEMGGRCSNDMEGIATQIPSVESDVRVRHSSWDRPSGNWDMSSDVLTRSASDVIRSSVLSIEAAPPSQTEAR
jgi:palmitoyltransferase ZDHHC9/14/18